MCSWHSFAPAATPRITIASALLVPLLLGCNFPINQLVGGAQPTTGPTYATQQQSLSNQSSSGPSSFTPLGPAATEESQDILWSKCPEGETVTTQLCFEHAWFYTVPMYGRTDVRYGGPYCIPLHIGVKGDVRGDTQDLRFKVSGHTVDPEGTIDMEGYVIDTPTVTGECIVNPDPNKGDHLHLKIHEVWGQQVEHFTITSGQNVTRFNLTLPPAKDPNMDNDLNFKVIQEGDIRATIPIPNGALVYRLYAPLVIPPWPLVTPY